MLIDTPARRAWLHEHTLVHTARGLVPAGDVRPGETIFSLDEITSEIRPAHVREVISAGSREVFEVKLSNRMVRTTHDTAFVTLVDSRHPGRQRRRLKRVWAPLGALKVGDVVGVALRTPDVGESQQLTIPVPRPIQLRRSNPITLPSESGPELMWWAGLFTGDGWITTYRGSKHVEFAIPESDQALRHELAAVTHRLFGLRVVPKSEWTVAVHSFRLADYLEANGFRGNARTKRIPAWVSALPEDDRLAFLGGYADADGCVAASRKDKGLSITSANPLLLEDARRVAATCGLSGSTYRFTSKYRGREAVAYRMRVLGDFDRVACRSPQRTTRLGRRLFKRTFSSIKAFGFRSHTNGWMGFAKIHRIEPIGAAGVCGIRVDAGGSLIAEGVIIQALRDPRE